MCGAKSECRQSQPTDRDRGWGQIKMPRWSHTDLPKSEPRKVKEKNEQHAVSRTLRPVTQDPRAPAAVEALLCRLAASRGNRLAHLLDGFSGFLCNLRGHLRGCRGQGTEPLDDL
jgi:hypothetical protein